ncbi:MAG: hypothetical protein JW946_03510, partial [Candidatus Omnitrophica bacterium]|nr:hypothetical protein [Candidatus Omnitrophota bacterium]
MRKGMYSGIIAAFVAMTRPDGIIFCVAYPTIIFLSVTVTGKPATDKPRSANLMAYLLGFAVLFGCFMAFRILYFNDIVPNSSYAVFKRADYVQNLFNLLTLRTGKMAFNLLVSMTGGTYYYLIKLFLFVATVFLIARRRFKIEHFVSGIFMLCAFSEYLLLPEEGIPEFRLATSFFLFFTIYLIVLFDLAVNNMFRSPRMRYIITAGVLLIFVAMRLPEFYVRSAWFAKNPFVPFSACARMFGNGFNILADSVGLRNGSVLLADVGGPLYCSKLRVYDLGGLCDKTIAKTLLKDQEKFYDYVFEEIKPVFIEVHNCWAYFANFHYDKRFERDYVPIREGENNNGLVVNFGYYVRRD